MPKIFMRAMALGESCHLMPFHNPGESSPFCPPYHIHQVSRLKELLDRDFASNLVGFNVVRAKLSKDGKRTASGLLAMPKHWLGDTMGFLGPKPELESRVTISLQRLLLHDGTGSSLDNRHTDEPSVWGKDLRHAQFLSDQTLHRCPFPSPI
jgi:hypothetical protein